MKTIHSFFVHGTNAVMANVECAASSGIGIHLVGLADEAVKQCLLRGTTAMMSYNYRIPGRKIIINVAPQVRGAQAANLDTAVVLAVLAETGQADLPLAKDFAVVSEIMLDGRLRGCKRGVVTMTEKAYYKGLRGIILNREDARRAATYAHVGEDFIIYGADSLEDVIHLLQEDDETFRARKEDRREPALSRTFSLSERTAEQIRVAAAAGFNVMITGNSQRAVDDAVRYLHAVTPPCSNGRIYDIIGQEPVTGTPLRRPHPSASLAALIGGGTEVLPGEVSLAHGGILCLDDILEWGKTVLEYLKNIQQDEKVTLARLNSKVSYPAIFVVAMTCYTNDMNDAAREKLNEKAEMFNAVTIRIDNSQRRMKITEEAIALHRKMVDEAKDKAWNRLVNSMASGEESQSVTKIRPVLNRAGLTERQVETTLKTFLAMTDLDEGAENQQETLLNALGMWDNMP